MSFREPQPGRVDLGHGCSYEFWNRTGDPETVHRGLIHNHPRPDTGEECGGSITFRGQHSPGETGPEWDVTSWEPLTLSPSLLCRTCGNHGFIRNGKWEPA